MKNVLKLTAVFFSLVIFSGPLRSAELSPAETKILSWIDATLMTSGMEFINQTVEINSGTHNRKGIRKPPVSGKMSCELNPELGARFWI